MSKIIVCLYLAVAYVHCNPVSTEKPVEILKYVYEPSVGDSGYHFEYETSDHQSKIEDGFIKNGTLSVNGSYTYIDTDGGTHTIQYVSDERGFSSKNLDVAAEGVQNRAAKNLPVPVSRSSAPAAISPAPAPAASAALANIAPSRPTTVTSGPPATLAAAVPTAAVPIAAVTKTVPPTTAAPTTAAKTTVAPTTAAPTTVAPTTAAPTTAASTSSAPKAAAPASPASPSPAPTVIIP